MSGLDTKSHNSPVSDAVDEVADLGIAGRTARFFIKSPLSPLLYITMFLLGLAGLIMTPRQEDPQISVPLIDLFIQYPGAPVEEVASLAIQPLERMMWEIQGVKHVYSVSQRGGGMVTVQFEVGEDMGPSLVKVNEQLASNMDKIPNGVSPPLVQAKGIDDVPVVTLTLWSDKDYNGDGIPDVDDSQLRRLALSVLQSIKEIPDTGKGFVVGGRAEQVTIEVLPERLAGYGISLGQVAQAIQMANAEQQAGNVESGGTHFTVVTGKFLQTADDINHLRVGSHNGVPVYVRDVAMVRQGPEDAKRMVAYYTGAASENPDLAVSVPAVTIAIAKKKGTNGVSVANKVLERIEELKGRLIPSNIEVSVTRNYGKTANDKVSALIFKLFVATFFVFILVWWAFRALKPAIVVLLVIPVVLLFTVFGAWMLGFTIDRVSLFALIFSIGILVDDAIVVVENIYRRWLEEGETDAETAVDAVREVGNPTILATLTVIGALLPMGFVSGMMGPYMMPIPALGSVAMVISLFAAFVFTPWLAIHPMFRPSMGYLVVAEKREHKEAEKLEKVFRKVLMPMIENPRKARLFRISMWAVFLIMCSLFYFKLVVVKMLPLDNKPEYSVVLDMPEGTALAETANRANQIANLVRKLPEVTAVQVYVGTAKPFDFNGMVRHYYLRKQPWQAEVQVQLLDKHHRKRTSHEIAVETRALIKEMLKDATGALPKFAVVEMPPGPPVLQSVVATVHGPDAPTRRQVTADLTELFKKAPNLVDVDNYMVSPHDYWRFMVDRDKADLRGISVDSINKNLAMALGGMVIGDVKQRAGHEPVNIVIQVPLAERSQITRLGDLLIQSKDSVGVPLRELGQFKRVQVEPSVFNKDLRAVEYVVADVGGRLAAPVYGMMQVEDLLKTANDGKPYITPDNVELAKNTYWTGPPPTDSQSSFEWTGEWTVTYETFRDMGIAFGAALVLIYILVVWEFGNFRIPALIMSPIPLTLLGIIPAHALFFAAGWGGEFTATSMIGWIALAGIIVRNSILLVDFSIHEVQKGVPVPEAVIKACKTRTRPILITAFALVFASSVIFFDPIFQGMAISLASGVLVSTILTLVVIPLGMVSASESLCEAAGRHCPKARKTPQGGGSTGGGGRSLLKRGWHVTASIIIAVVSFTAAVIRLFLPAKKSGKTTATPASAPAAATKPAPPPPEPEKPRKEAAAPAKKPEEKPARKAAGFEPELDAALVDDAELDIESIARPIEKPLAEQKPTRDQMKKTVAARKTSVKEASPKKKATRKAAARKTTVVKEAPATEKRKAAAQAKTPARAATATAKKKAPVAKKVQTTATTKKKAAAAPKASATKKPAVASKAKAPVKKVRTAKKAPAGKKAAPARKKMPKNPVVSATVAKKSGRRGIRLKSLDSTDDGLSS
ncbi:efflux RND transporter permease subunit [Thiolapillus sp.]|uniref:efflux RND transporter permease subunit n=8 Tax=Thiolapillus sp. TaxID=2017437 RepID=UPI003AF6D82E